jgi:hypothetical protein
MAVAPGLGALIGVPVYAPADAFATLSRGAAEVKPLWQRRRQRAARSR